MARVPKPTVRAFVHEYVWGEFAGNATEAARLAGFCKRNRKSQREYGCKLLRKPQVRELVEAESTEKERQLKQKAARAAEETFTLSVADIGDAFDEEMKLLPLHEMPAEVRRAIASIEVEELFEGQGQEREQVGYTKKVKLHDKRAAQELFLKYAGKLKDTIKIEDGLTLEDLVPKRKPKEAT